MFAYGPLFMTMGGERAPPPTRGPRRGQRLSRGGGVTSVPARPCRSVGCSRQTTASRQGPIWGGGGSLCRFILFAPLLGAVGWVGLWLVRSPPPPPGWSLPQVDWVLACPPPPGCVGWPGVRAVVCVGVCKVHRLPSGSHCAPCFSRAVLPGASKHKSGQGGFPCRSQTQDFVKHLPVSFFRAAIRATCGVKVGIMGRPSPRYSTFLPSG